MEKVKIAINSLVGSIVTTMILVTGNFLIVLFSSGEDGTRKIYFDTLFFKSETDVSGTTIISFGLTQHYLPLIVSIVLIFVFLFFAQNFYKILLERKKKLTNEF